MSEYRDLMHELDELIRSEKAIIDHYEHAREYAHKKYPDRAIMFDRLETAHRATRQKLSNERERLQHEHGERIIGDAIASMSNALSSVVAGLAVKFIESETTPNSDTLTRLEHTLLEHYEHVRPKTQGKTRELIDESIEACREYINQLSSLTEQH
jgi:hypothetical protein